METTTYRLKDDSDGNGIPAASYTWAVLWSTARAHGLLISSFFNNLRIQFSFQCVIFFILHWTFMIFYHFYNFCHWITKHKITTLTHSFIIAFTKSIDRYVFTLSPLLILDHNLSSGWPIILMIDSNWLHVCTPGKIGLRTISSAKMHPADHMSTFVWQQNFILKMMYATHLIKHIIITKSLMIMVIRCIRSSCREPPARGTNGYTRNPSSVGGTPEIQNLSCFQIEILNQWCSKKNWLNTTLVTFPKRLPSGLTRAIPKSPILRSQLELTYRMNSELFKIKNLKIKLSVNNKNHRDIV